MNKDYNDLIVKIIKENPSCYTTKITRKLENRYLYDYIMEMTKDFPDLNCSTRIYWILNDIHEYPKCKVCGNEIRHNAICRPLTGYTQETCSNSCAQKNPSTREKMRLNSLKKYGTECPQKSKEYREKLKNILENKDQSHWNESLKKRRTTCMKKYGVDSITKVYEIRKRAAETFKNIDPVIKQEIMRKRTASKIKKYGIDNISNQRKMKDTISKFSNEKIADIKRRKMKTVREKYGVDYVCQIQKAKDRVVSAQRKFHYENYIVKDKFVEPLFSLEEYMCCEDTSKLKWRCKNCGNVFQSGFKEHSSYMIRCMKCKPLLHAISNTEKELVKFIRKNYKGRVIPNSRKIISPRELDIYIPDLNIAFEYDGMYWHSENMGTPKEYHIEKTECCNEKGIKLIHIFENDYLNRPEIVKSIILSKLGIYERTVDSKECILKEIDNETSNVFLIQNSIYGRIDTSVRYGLYYNDELVYVMCFRKSTVNNGYEWELVRFCNKMNINVINGFNVCIDYFRNNMCNNSILMNVDRKTFDETDFGGSGFKLKEYTKPDFFWYRHGYDSEIHSRFEYNIDKIRELIPDYDDNMSEYENMDKNGYYRIWDCGKIRMVIE